MADSGSTSITVSSSSSNGSTTDAQGACSSLEDFVKSTVMLQEFIVSFCSLLVLSDFFLCLNF